MFNSDSGIRIQIGIGISMIFRNCGIGIGIESKGKLQEGITRVPTAGKSWKMKSAEATEVPLFNGNGWANTSLIRSGPLSCRAK